MSNLKFSQRGFSLMETIITVGLTGFIGLSVVQLTKQSNDQKKKVEKDTEFMTAMKLMESRLLTKDGCQSLVGKKPGEQIVVNSEATEVAANNVKPKMTLHDFVASDEEENSGLAVIRTTMEINNRTKATDFYIPVSRAADGSIASCNLSYLKMYSTIKDMICPKTFGSSTQSMTSCALAMNKIYSEISADICDDLYGSKPGVMNGTQCNLALLHQGKECANNGNPVHQRTHALTAFDNNAEVQCSPIAAKN